MGGLRLPSPGRAHPLYGTRPPAYGEPPGGPLFGPSNLNGRCDRSGPGMSVRHSCHFLRTQRDLEASVIDILANSKIRLNSVKRMTQSQNTSQSFAETKYFRVAAREHTLAPPGRHRSRHSRMSLTARQNTPAIDAAIYHPNSTLYQLQPSFHTQSTEPEPTARARRAGEEFY